MLTHLSVSNFTLVESLELEIAPGMTAITGETGAGKSILLDALGLALGDRADPDRVRTGAERADIHASFDISTIPAAHEWLVEHDLKIDDECLLRRTVTTEGRSRAYINGHPATLQQLKGLGERLLDIHSQHAHQSLLKKDNHRRLLDEFGQLQELATQVSQAHNQWQQLQQQFTLLRDNSEEMSARFQLLSYQVEELDLLDLNEGEIAELESEQKRLANADTILRNSQQLSELCTDEQYGLLEAFNKALHLLSEMPEKTGHLLETEQLLISAQIQAQEAQRELDTHIDGFELDPERLQTVEERLSSCYEIARKHRVQPEELIELHQNLSEELQQLSGGDAKLEELEQQVNDALANYHQLATKLSKKRGKAAKQLSQEINEQLQALAMKNALLEVACNTDTERTSSHGLDDIEFLISTNPGQPPRPLAKVASGGELSRVSLAIQVITARSSTIPTLVFDEVDVGIGGATGDVVGQLLRQLGDQGQVICVTHLAQVASKAHQHLQVSKESDKKSTQSTLVPLVGDSRIEEIARMMGGAKITEQSLAHAREMAEAV
ncbi:DNA repair protein RecN [Maricurvus nonylphenolicus]|uniref:DNA repair protein RecN n=1 Tax=Maricurvus nonylphenolicus TaxID=1008307 RepID=UPI0036F42ACE